MSEYSPLREFFLHSYVGCLWDVLGMGRIVVHTRSFLCRMALRRFQLLVFAGYLYPLLCFFFFPCSRYMDACYSITVSGKFSVLSVPHPRWCVFAWCISSLCLLFSSLCLLSLWQGAWQYWFTIRCSNFFTETFKRGSFLFLV